MKTCKRCFKEFEEPEVDVVDVSLATELKEALEQEKDIGDLLYSAELS